MCAEESELVLVVHFEVHFHKAATDAKAFAVEEEVVVGVGAASDGKFAQ